MLNDENKNFCDLFDQIPEMVCILSGPEHIFDFVNTAHIKALGFDATNMTVRAARPDSVEVLRILDDVYKTGVTAERREIAVTLNGRRRYFNMTYSPRFDEQKKVNGVMILGSEITDQVLFRETIKYQNQALELLLNGHSVESVLKLLAVAVETMTGSDTRVAISKFDEVKKTLRHGAAPQLGQTYIDAADNLPIGENIGTCGVAAWLGEEVDTPDISQDPHWQTHRALAEAHNLKSCWSFPIKSSRGQMLGTFALYNLSPEYRSSTYKQIFELLKKTASLVLERQLDIEKRALTETALQYTEEQLHMAVAVSGVGFYDWDVINDRMVFSPQMKRDWGMDQNTKFKTLDDAALLIHEDDRERVIALINEAIKKHAPYEVEYRVVHPTGECIWVEVRGQITYHEDGRPLRFFGTSVNINDRKLHEQSLRESEEQFRLFAEIAPQMPFIADANGSIEYFNQRWFDYLGFKGRETKGWQWTAAGVLHPDDLNKTIDTWRDSLKTGEPFQIEHRILRHDGQYRWHLARALPIRDPQGKINRWFGTNVDIHDHKVLTEELSQAIATADLAKEAAEKANNVKSAFLANMSHEIRTPLGAILGFTDLLKQSPAGSEENEVFLETISRNGKALTRIIDDILDLSKVEAGRLDLEKIDFSLHLLLTDVVALFSEKTKAQGVPLNIQIADGTPDLITSDPTRLRQILINIVGNAVKFTSKGSISISVTSKRLLSDVYTVDIRVKDTGGGIEPLQLEKVFLPFNQGDNSTARRFGGSGLGLPLSRKLARALGGDVHVEQNDGVAAAFLSSVLTL